MDSRERFFISKNHQEPDRVPIDFWSTPEVSEKLQKHFRVETREELLDIIDVDLRYIEGPRYIGPKLKQYTDGSQDDIWGVARKEVTTGSGDLSGSYKTVTNHPLQNINTVDEAEKYSHWPSPDWYDYSDIKRQCEQIRRKNRIVVFVGDRTNRIAQLKPYMYIRGTEECYLDMLLNTELFIYITEKIRVFYSEYLTRIIEASEGKIDILMTGDDFGSQHNLLCSRDTWMQLLQPGFKHYLNIIKQANMITMHHSCGAVASIIDDMIDAGLDILQSVQPEATGMNGHELKEKFGGRICFNGSLSIQRTLPFGSPDEIKKEVERQVNYLASKGGFIIGTAHNIQADVPLENCLALIDAYKEMLWY